MGTHGTSIALTEVSVRTKLLQQVEVLYCQHLTKFGFDLAEDLLNTLW